MDKNGKFPASIIRGVARETLAHKAMDTAPAEEDGIFEFRVEGGLAEFIGVAAPPVPKARKRG